MAEELVAVRCPFKVKDRYSERMYTCDRICVKVIAPARGEAWCRECKLKFDFDVEGQQVTSKVRARKVTA